MMTEPGIDTLRLLDLTIHGGSGTGRSYTDDEQRQLQGMIADRQKRRDSIRRAVLRDLPAYTLFAHTESPCSSSHPGSYLDVLVDGVKIGRVKEPGRDGELWTGEYYERHVYSGGPFCTAAADSQDAAVAEVIIGYICYRAG